MEKKDAKRPEEKPVSSSCPAQDNDLAVDNLENALPAADRPDV